jgi:hypothetical protein
MPELLPERLGLLARAAELRAGGTPWTDVATQLATNTDELRRLTCEHAGAFGRLRRRAGREFRREVMAASVARLRDLLRSHQEGVALAAAATLVRYDLALMRDRRQARADRKARHKRRGRGRRDELPPRPGLTVAAEPAEPVEAPEVTKRVEAKSAAESARRNSPTPAPQVVAAERVPAAPPGAEKRACDTGCDSAPVSTPAKPRGSTKRVDAIRRGRWFPPGLAPPR